MVPSRPLILQPHGKMISDQMHIPTAIITICLSACLTKQIDNPPNNAELP
jgi:hypothetical protein